MCFAITQTGFAQKNKNIDYKNVDDSFSFISSKNLYHPYLQVGGTQFINTDQSKQAVGMDLFIPLLQSSTDLIFTHLRFYDRTGTPYEGNIHLGYRMLLPEQQYLFGVYAAYDRNRSNLGNYYNQITIGGEAWFDRIFLGANIYLPLGNSSNTVGLSHTDELRKVSANIYNRWITTSKQEEKAMSGFDALVGYELIDGLTFYAGGYHFSAKDMETIAGPKAKISYDLSLDNGKRILGIFNKVSFETGVQRDKPRGTIGYIGINAQIGLSNDNSKLKGVARHMVDLVRRDVDIVSNDGITSSSEEVIKDASGKPEKIKVVGNSSKILSENDGLDDLMATKNNETLYFDNKAATSRPDKIKYNSKNLNADMDFQSAYNGKTYQFKIRNGKLDTLGRGQGIAFQSGNFKRAREILKHEIKTEKDTDKIRRLKRRITYINELEKDFRCLKHKKDKMDLHINNRRKRDSSKKRYGFDHIMEKLNLCPKSGCPSNNNLIKRLIKEAKF